MAAIITNRLIMHLDLDAFYAAIEQHDHPDWRDLPVRLIGVGLSGWEPAACPTQPDLFAASEPQPTTLNTIKLDQTLDAIRDKLGDGLIQRGVRRS